MRGRLEGVSTFAGGESIPVVIGDRAAVVLAGVVQEAHALGLRRATKVGIVAAGVALIAAGAFVCSSAGTRDAVFARSVGPLPWSSALASRSTDRTIAVQVDVAAHDRDLGSGCGVSTQVMVSETAASVTIWTRAIVRPLPLGVACAGAGLITVPATVHLKAPVGARRLIDGSTMKFHRLLITDEQPTLHHVPPPFTRRATGWDENRGTISEWWRWQQHGQSAQIDLAFGRPSGLFELALRPSAAIDASIGTATAHVWRERSGDLLTTTIAWSPRSDLAFQLTVLDETRHPYSTADALALARSIR